MTVSVCFVDRHQNFPIVHTYTTYVLLNLRKRKKNLDMDLTNKFLLQWPKNMSMQEAQLFNTDNTSRRFTSISRTFRLNMSSASKRSFWFGTTRGILKNSFGLRGVKGCSTIQWLVVVDSWLSITFPPHLPMLDEPGTNEDEDDDENEDRLSHAWGKGSWQHHLHSTHTAKTSSFPILCPRFGWYY